VADTIPDLCVALATAFREGRLDGLSDHYIYPLAIYSPAGLWIEASPQETADVIFLRRAAAVQAGMADLRLTIGEIAEVEGERQRVGVTWEFLGSGGVPLARSVLNYFCRRCADGALRVEMIDFSELAFSQAGRPNAMPPRRN
jgi:hypothetical protein